MSSFKSIYWRVRITHRSLRRPKFCSFKYRSYTKQNMTKSSELYTATSRKVVGKSARDNPERYCGWVWVRCSSQKFEGMTGEAMDVCLRVLKESNKRIFDSYSARNRQCIDHIKYYSFGIIASTFLPTAFLEIAVYAVLSECLFWHSKRTGLVRDSTRLIVSAALLRNDIPERNNKPVSGYKKGLLLSYGWLRGRNSWRSLRPPPNPLCPS